MPDWTSLVRNRLRELSPDPPDPEVVDELALHLAQIYDEARADGIPHDQAWKAIEELLEPSNPFLQALEARKPRGRRRVHEWIRQEPSLPQRRGAMGTIDITRDIRYAMRMLIRTPGFSAIAILTFAIGIGVNTAVFSVVNGVLLRALPYPDADRITMVWLDNRRQGIKEDITSYPNYVDWRDQSSSYASLAAFTPASFTLTGAGEPERLQGALATANFFAVMGVEPLLGRVYTGENEVEGKDRVVVLSYGLWQRRFGGAADAIGRTLSLNGRPHEVIGVMRSELRWPERAELWVPLAPGEERNERFSFWLPVIGRLKPGVTVEQAQAEMSGISSRLEAAYPNMRGFGAYVVGLKEQVIGGVQRGLLVLMAAVGFVLLIACVNLANLMLGRTAARQRELAIRTALGAARARIIAQIVTEALVLALLGGALGVLCAYWGTTFFVTLGGDSIPRAESIGLDRPVLLFALALATIAALLSGLAPALQASRTAVVDHLREGGRQGGSVASRRTRSVLVAVEVALAVVLLTGSGLLIRTLWNMQNLDRGFDATHVAMATVSLPGVSYTTPADVRGFHARLLERVRALPGVESAALTTGVLQPLVTNSGIYSIEGRPLPPPEERVEYPFEIVSPGFFETLRIPLVRGRTFSDQDHAAAPRAVIINETLARQGWPGEDAIGRRIRSGGDNSQSPWMTVVGVIKDVHRVDPHRPIRPELYMCSLQVTPRTQSIVARTAGEPAAILPAIRREVQGLDPQLALYRSGTLAGQVSATLNQPRFQATLLGAFAAVALLLATIGIYGVTSHAVGQRTQEVGIRMALGARKNHVLGMILEQHLRPALAGIVVGIAAALALSRYLESLLYGIRAADPTTFVIMAVGLFVVAVAACLIPARRAMRVDPLIALRNE
jgi:putative ABC transport system permease protein